MDADAAEPFSRERPPRADAENAPVDSRSPAGLVIKLIPGPESISYPLP